MGQAKKRGSFEQRQEIAIEKAAKEAYDRKQELIATEEAKTPAERKRGNNAKLLLASMIAMTGVK